MAKIWTQFFFKECIITKKWMTTTCMPPDNPHKIVHSSAMYYQNLNVICESSKKLLTIKSVKCFVWHLVHQICAVRCTLGQHVTKSLWINVKCHCNVPETWNKTTHSTGWHVVPQWFLRSSDWLLLSELGYCAHSLISGLNDDAATLMSSIVNGT